MRPDIGDLIEGIKRSLNEEILPVVDNAFAREQLAYTLFLCEHLARRWDQAHIFAQGEHDDLRRTLAAVVEIGCRCTAPTARLVASLEAARVALSAAPDITSQPLRVVSSFSQSLTERVVQLLDACEESAPADAAACTAIADALRAFVQRQQARDEQWVTDVQIGWW